MSDIVIIILITAGVFVLFVAPRLLHIEKGRRAIMSEAWRREQMKKEEK